MTIRRVFVILFVVQLFNIALRPGLDPDMWWHLRTGELILKRGIPRQDVFSFTVLGHPWTTHEWLSETLMWLLYQVGGLNLLSITFAGLTALAFWLVYACCAGRPYLAAAVVILGEFSAASTFGIRPQAFNLLFAAAFVNIVERFKQRQVGRSALLLLPLLSVLWANLHSGYLLGVVLLATYAAGSALELVGGQRGKVGFGDVRLLALAAIGCLLVAVLNPHGYHLWTYPFGTLGSTAMQQNIQEWMSPDFHEYKHWAFAAMMGLGVAGWAGGRAWPGWTDLLLFLGTASAGLVSRRHIPIFAVVAAPIICRSLLKTAARTALFPLLSGERKEAPMNRTKATVHWAALLVGVITAGIWARNKLADRPTAIAHQYPVAAADFLERENLNGAHGYNTYGWGGYLIWRGIPVFVDGRADVYGDEFLSYYMKAFRLEEDWRKPLDDFNVAYVLIERSNPLGSLLAATNDWHEAYTDEIARIFVRSKKGDRANSGVTPPPS